MGLKPLYWWTSSFYPFFCFCVTISFFPFVPFFLCCIIFVYGFFFCMQAIDHGNPDPSYLISKAPVAKITLLQRKSLVNKLKALSVLQSTSVALNTSGTAATQGIKEGIKDAGQSACRAIQVLTRPDSATVCRVIKDVMQHSNTLCSGALKPNCLKTLSV